MMLVMLQTPHVTLKRAYLRHCYPPNLWKGISTNLVSATKRIFFLFSFVLAAQSEGSIPLHEGEELFVIEVDQGDGWTRVRRNSGFEEGFVPTSYIQCTLYNNC